MHEMGVAMEIVEIAISSIPANIKNACVESVNLKVGKLSAIVPESLRFCFDIVSKDTPLAGAKLNIEDVPVVVRCRECDLKWTINSPVFKCKKCKSGLIDIVSGRELDIISIEVVDEQGE
jgi:hydrogenase nickel incorporation protein HypA/HybF